MRDDRILTLLWSLTPWLVGRVIWYKSRPEIKVMSTHKDRSEKTENSWDCKDRTRTKKRNTENLVTRRQLQKKYEQPSDKKTQTEQRQWQKKYGNIQNKYGKPGDKKIQKLSSSDTGIKKIAGQ